MNDRNDKSNATGSAFHDHSESWLRSMNFTNIRKPDRHPSGSLWDLEATDMSGKYCLVECKGSSTESTKTAGERTCNHKKFLGEWAELQIYHRANPHEIKPRVLYLLSHEIPYGKPTQWAEKFDLLQLWGELEVHIVPFVFSFEAAA